ncbi:MAG TPA: hypothetical protein VEA99_14030, partial [Gemmatimonadaceae bacterium]|nr:hypothetical protein [Gemmatimonadaceae bacterium]
MRLARWTGGVVLLSLGASCSGNGPAGGPGPIQPLCATTFVNPIAAGADPWVARRGRTYHLVES